MVKISWITINIMVRFGIIVQIPICPIPDQLYVHFPGYGR